MILGARLERSERGAQPVLDLGAMPRQLQCVRAQFLEPARIGIELGADPRLDSVVDQAQGADEVALLAEQFVELRLETAPQVLRSLVVLRGEIVVELLRARLELRR